MEEQELNAAPVAEVELEEDIIPSEDAQGGGLDDVVPCEYVAVEQQADISYDMAGSSSDGFYDNVENYTPSLSTSQMVDIAPHSEESSSNLLEEDIPNLQNVNDGNELADVA